MREVCALVHEHGGQVYLDGANMNAQVGLTSPARIGADVCHLNLHKTFCIPHGGGGPGMGPIAAAKHLEAVPARRSGHRRAARLRGAVRQRRHPADPLGLHRADGRARASRARPRSRSSTPTTWRRASREHYEVLYRGARGRVAHEFIIDCRRFERSAGIARGGHRQAADGLRLPRPDHELPGGRHADDRADRERVARRELDRLCDALIAIRARDPRDRARRARTPRTTRCGNAPAHRGGGLRGRLAPPLHARSRRPGRRPGCASTSTGRRSGASTTPTAIATSSAPARRSRSSRKRI